MMGWPRDWLGAMRQNGWALRLAGTVIRQTGITPRLVRMSQTLVRMALRLVGRTVRHAGVSLKLIGLALKMVRCRQTVSGPKNAGMTLILVETARAFIGRPCDQMGCPIHGWDSP